MRVHIHPLSVNKAWRGGRRFKTHDYLQYEKELSSLLPRRQVVSGPVSVSLTFSLNQLYRADLDNFIKPLMDILVKRQYIDDDRKVLKYVLEKKKTQGVEYIDIEINKI